MYDYEKYVIALGQHYAYADGSKGHVVVVDVKTYALCDDVVIYDPLRDSTKRIDCFKLAMVRYYLLHS